MSGQAEVSEGSCLCGLVRYRVRGPLGVMDNCHCTDCRKSHGAAFATYLGVSRARLTWHSGENNLAGWSTETGTRRDFCRTCGSNILCTVKSEPETVYIPAAVFDTPIHQKPEYHIFVRSRVPWCEIRDGLPQYKEFADE